MYIRPATQTPHVAVPMQRYTTAMPHGTAPPTYSKSLENPHFLPYGSGSSMPSKPSAPLPPTVSSSGTVAKPHFQFYAAEHVESTGPSKTTPTSALALDRLPVHNDDSSLLKEPRNDDPSLLNDRRSGEAEALRITRQAVAGELASVPICRRAKLRSEDSFYVLQKTLCDKKKMTEYKLIKSIANQKKSTPLHSKQLLPERRDASVPVDDHPIPCQEVPIPLAPRAAPSIQPHAVATVTSPVHTNSSFLQYFDTAWREHIDAIDLVRDGINFHGASEERSGQCRIAQKANEDHAMCRSAYVDVPEQKAATVKDSSSMWSWDTQIWSDALDMFNRALEVGGQAIEVGGQQLLHRHGVFSEANETKGNCEVTTDEGESMDSEQTSQCSERHDDQKGQSVMPSAAVHVADPTAQDQTTVALPYSAQKLPGVDVSAEGAMEDDDSTQQQNTGSGVQEKKGSDMHEDREVSAVPCHGSDASGLDAFTWVRESMPVAASCQGPSESKEPVYLEALHDEMPRGLRKERNLKKFLKDDSKSPALFGKVVGPSSKSASGMACPDLSQEDQDALKKMLQMWAPGPNQDDDGGDLTSGIDGNSADGKNHKKSWAARCVPCRGKLPDDRPAQKKLRSNSGEAKAHRKGIFRFLPSR